nr:MAG TPA: hypothetical protein [Caudoviricetes sp.]
MRQIIGLAMILAGIFTVESKCILIPALLICAGAVLALTKNSPTRNNL